MFVKCDDFAGGKYAQFTEEEMQLRHHPNQKYLDGSWAFIKSFSNLFSNKPVCLKSFAERCSVYVADGLNVPEPELTRWLLSSCSLSL